MVERPAGSLLMAGREADATGGLYLATPLEGAWQVRQADHVPDLAALGGHPALPLVYGVSALGEGALVWWSMTESLPRRRGRLDLGLRDVCHVAVSPEGSMVVVVGFGDGSGGGLRVWPLDGSGDPIGTGSPIALEQGSGVVAGVQDAPHPHQAVFHGGVLFVPDLGADRIRRFAVDHAALVELPPVVLPPGTGPRHLVVLSPPGSDGPPLVAVSGELAQTVLVGVLDPERPHWRVAPSTARSGPASTRSERNYPGDIQASADGRLVYLANRGYDTIAVFAVVDGAPRLLAEQALPLRWPQHLALSAGRLVVAGQDSSVVVSAELAGGLPGDFGIDLDCPQPGWIQVVS